MSKSQRIFIIAGVAALVIIGAVGLLINHQNNVKSGNVQNQEKEGDILQNTPFVINNTSGLANLLLIEQFQAVQANLTSYLQSKYPNAKSANVVATPIVANDGTIGFQLQIPAYNKTVSVNIQTLIHGAVMVTIPQDNYSANLDVYGNDSTTNTD